MADVSKRYVKGVHKRFKYLATWFPNAHLKLGDVGIREGDEFKQMTTLDALGISFKVREGKDVGNFTGTSNKGITLKTKVKGEVAAGSNLPLAKAGVSMEFTREGSFLFQAIACKQDEIEDKAAVGKAVIEKMKAGDFNPDWGVVDTLVSATTSTIVVSNSQSSALELEADAPIAELDLAKLDTGLTVSSQSGDVLHFIASEGLSPLYKLSRVKKSFIGSIFGSSGAITFGGASDEEEPEPEGDPFEDVEPE